MNPKSVFWCERFVSSLVAALALAGCSGVTAPAAPASPSSGRPEIVRQERMVATLPKDAREISFAFQPAVHTPRAMEISSLLRSRLTLAGFRLVDVDAPGCDARLEVDVQPTRSRPDEDQVSLLVSQHGRIIESLVIPVEGPLRSDNATRIGELVDRLSSMPGLAMLAESAAKSAAARRSKLLSAAPEARVEFSILREDELFSSVAVRRCRNSKRVGACDQLRQYLERFPNGSHAEDARAALTLSGAPPRIAE
ncbi:MAG: hypothetical protein HOW73_30605 [Polyangiaceae bacterium]|nr:hypothetical protein [Polyangiaceae bacterium]